jgi:hypothetical protein
VPVDHLFRPMGPEHPELCRLCSLAKDRHPALKIGTGMPGTTKLEGFGQYIRDAFGHVAYQVGSSLFGKEWRDVDVRLILPDDEFAAMFPGYARAKQRDPKWSLICEALSELGRIYTGMPVDFQIQSQKNADRFSGPRNPLFRIIPETQ